MSDSTNGVRKEVVTPFKMSALSLDGPGYPGGWKGDDLRCAYPEPRDWLLAKKSAAGIINYMIFNEEKRYPVIIGSTVLLNTTNMTFQILEIILIKR